MAYEIDQGRLVISPPTGDPIEVRPGADLPNGLAIDLETLDLVVTSEGGTVIRIPADVLIELELAAEQALSSQSQTDYYTFLSTDAEDWYWRGTNEAFIVDVWPLADGILVAEASLLATGRYHAKLVHLELPAAPADADGP